MWGEGVNKVGDGADITKPNPIGRVKKLLDQKRDQKSKSTCLSN